MRAAFARASRKSWSRDKEQPGAESIGDHPSTKTGAANTDQSGTKGNPIKVKVKSASVESNQTISSPRWASRSSYEDDAAGGGCIEYAPGQAGARTLDSKRRSSSFKRGSSSSNSGGKNLLFAPLLTPSRSTSDLFSGTGCSLEEEEGVGAAALGKDCDIGGHAGGILFAATAAAAAKGKQNKQQATSALICIPTKASLTHEWRKLKTPNKCRECNLWVYFNGRECSSCGFVVHKKCITVMVIKCSRMAADHAKPLRQPPHSPSAALAQSMGSLSAALLNLRSQTANNQHIRPFSNNNNSSNINNNNDTNNNHRFLSNYKTANQTLSTAPGLPPPQTPIFGRPLADVDCKQVLDFINRFIYEIDTRGLSSKGIYRVSSLKSKVEKLCHYYDQNPSNLIDLSSFHPNIIANALKVFLRRLPEPLLTIELHDEFVELARRFNSTEPGLKRAHTISGASSGRPPEVAAGPVAAARIIIERQRAIDQSSSCSSSEEESGEFSGGRGVDRAGDILHGFTQVVEKLPPINKRLAAVILCHLRRVAEMAEENHMSAKNLSIIFGPTLLSAEKHNSSKAIADYVHQARIVELMIDGAYQIFPHPESVASTRASRTSISESTEHHHHHHHRRRRLSPASSQQETAATRNEVQAVT